MTGARISVELKYFVIFCIFLQSEFSRAYIKYTFLGILWFCEKEVYLKAHPRKYFLSGGVEFSSSETMIFMCLSSQFM